MSLLFTLANADLAPFWPCFQKALCSALRLGERPLAAPVLPHDLALCPVTRLVRPSPHTLGASRPGAGAHSSCHTQLAGLRQFTGGVSLLESEHVCILGERRPTLVACPVYSSWVKNLGPFLCHVPCFFLSKEAPREGLGLQWRALLSLKTKEGKPYLILSSQHFDFFHSLFSEQASSEYLGKCL